jgi:RNA polymerase sigma-70 factor (ECF subfamily)
LGHETDSEIVARVLAGDRECFGELVERHGRALLGYLGRRTGAEEARELFQETLVRAFEGLGGLRDPERVRGWMISIASNTLGKRRRRREPLPLEAAGTRHAPDETGAGLEAAERRARIEHAVGGLPERQREVFELRALQELSYAEVADLLGIREDNARANFHQAVRKLREKLGDERW